MKWKKIAFLLTFTRLIIGLPILILLQNKQNEVAFFLLLFGATTDFLDGFITRKFNCKSIVGARLDPLADKILLLGPLIWIANQEIVPTWSIWLLLARELIISAWRSSAESGGFTPGIGDFHIYRHTDRQGLWVARLGNKPIGCIAGIRYNSDYGFIGLFLVVKDQRGKGYGLKLWDKALTHLSDLPCIGLEAAPNRKKDYEKWGFCFSSTTTRWQWIGSDRLLGESLLIEGHSDINFLEGTSIPSKVVQSYDEKREASPRPHFLSDWLNHPAGNVFALVDNNDKCYGFGRIRPCLLKHGKGWRIGPLIANNPQLAESLLRRLVYSHPGTVLLDSPGLNSFSNQLFTKLGFKECSQTFRMYKGTKPGGKMNEVYALACLELG